MCLISTFYSTCPVFLVAWQQSRKSVLDSTQNCLECVCCKYCSLAKWYMWTIIKPPVKTPKYVEVKKLIPPFIVCHLWAQACTVVADELMHDCAKLREPVSDVDSGDLFVDNYRLLSCCYLLHKSFISDK